METQTHARPPRVIRERALLYVFLAFLLGFVLPVCGCLVSGAALFAAISRAAQTAPTLALATRPAVAIIRAEGVISSQGDPYSELVTPQEMADLLEQAARDTNIRAVVLRVESPGGGVVASDEIYRAIRAFEKPVVVSMGDVAASGGYYISCGADYVFAHPNTLTGSIGVISQFPNIEGLLDKVGVDVLVITSGPAKDIGSLFRDMTPEEQALWERIIQETYDDFVAVVAEGRGLPVEQVRELADGRIYTGHQALEAELVDELGTLEDAVARAAELGEIEGEPEVIELQPPPSFRDLLFGAQASSGLPSLEDLLGWGAIPSLQYRYVGP
jgi:protease-4